VDAAAGRRRARADVEPLVRRRIRVQAHDGPREELPEGIRAAADVAADHVLVDHFVPGGRDRVAREDPVAKARREALDLALDPLRHVHVRAVRHVAVGPSRLLAVGRAARIEEALLREEHVGTLRVLAVRHLGLGRRHLCRRAAEVDRRCERARVVAPRDRAVERPVDLEGARAVAERLELLDVTGRQLVACDLDQLSRRQIEEHRARRRHVAHRADPVPDMDRAAEALEARRERGDDRLGPAARERPPDLVSREQQDEPERRGRGLVEPRHRVRGAAGEERFCLLARELALDDAFTGTQADEPEPAHQHGMARDPDRLEDLGEELRGVLDEGADEVAVRFGVRPERGDGLVDQRREERRRTVVERVRERERRFDPLDAPPLDVDVVEEGRERAHRMDRRTDVVQITGLGELEGARSTADRLVRLEDTDRQPRARDLDRGAEAVRSCSHHDRVVRGTHHKRSLFVSNQLWLRSARNPSTSVTGSLQVKFRHT
jgi:hypothetical protein